MPDNEFKTNAPEIDITAECAMSPTLPPHVQHSAHMIGKRIGHYTIIEQLGTGGMGEVYKAERRSTLQQMVAIKVVKLGFDTHAVVARFDSERQALARMNHPNIARIFDAGTTDAGRPYFVMEYVPGRPITSFADDNHLVIRDRLLLFIQVCDAIAHAHTKGIIHRDIKDSNVLAYMSNGKPIAKVIDFGIAKALTGDRLTDLTLNTEQHGVIGTIENMSPEQADGSPDIDTRTDVYSLGILLYELLVGLKPFDSSTLKSASFEEIRRVIRDVDPPRPSTRLSTVGPSMPRIATNRQAALDALQRELRSELEWIPLKALRKERSRRYTGPLQLVEDIENYLHQRPLIAAPESGTYRIRKYLERNWKPVAALSIVIFVLLLGVIGTSAGFLGQRRLRALAESEKSEALAQKKEALVQAANAESISQFQEDMLSAADPEKSFGEQVTVLQAIKAALGELDSGKLKDQPLAEAGVRCIIGKTLDDLDQTDLGGAQLEKGLAMRRAILPQGHPDIAKALDLVGYHYYHTNQLARARESFVEALAINQALWPGGHSNVARALVRLGFLEMEEGKFADAEGHFRQSLVSCGKEPNKIVGWTMEGLGRALQNQNKLNEAESVLTRGLEIEKQEAGSDHYFIAQTMCDLGNLLVKLGKNDQAEETFRHALEIYRRRVPAGSDYLDFVENPLANLLKREHRFADAEPIFRELLTNISRRERPDNEFARQIASDLADCLDGMHRGDEAISLRSKYRVSPATQP